MSNLISIPFKKSYPTDIKTAARAYISARGGAHPDEFRDDIKAWQDLRTLAIKDSVHERHIDDILLYHAQLVFILAKLPLDIQLEISYAPAFSPSAIPITLNNLSFERASLLFNLAALYSQLGASADRSTADGIKSAAVNFKYAAGTLSYLHSAVLPKLVYSPEDQEEPLDLSTDFVKALEVLMLAQAQECSWQMAKLGSYGNSLIAKIAAATSTYYRNAATMMKGSSTKYTLPSDWLPYIEAKEGHFSAVAHYRESMVEYEASRYGDELGRLIQARIDAKRAYDTARKGKVPASVVHDAQSILDILVTSEARAQRDNDLIYHKAVPSPSALSPVQEKTLVASTVPKSLLNPDTILDGRPPLFARLVGWGAREAINIYNDRKAQLIQERVIGVVQEIRDQADEELRKLNLPAALEALERPVGLPPSLLRKAEEVRLEDGPAKIEASIEDVSRLAHQDMAILEEALDILDSEASEDEAARKEVPLDRLKSHEANIELIEKAVRYRTILTQAAESDEHVRRKWDEWEPSITGLTLDEADLESSVPSTTNNSEAQTSPLGQQTRQHARALRVKLEELDTLHRDCDQLVHRARTLANADDIQPRVFLAASGFERLADVTPDMFEDVLDEELAKFDKFLAEMNELVRKQNETLDDIRNRNRQFLDSRKDDPIIKERESALQSLDLAYAKYREITRNLDEGFKFYNDLAGILMQYKEVCKTWCLHRNQEIHSLSRAMQSVSLERTSPESSPKAQTPTHATGPSRKPLPGKSSLGLPSINSSEWEFEELAIPPGPGNTE